MTRHKSFKRLVRTRMAKTGESYSSARAMLLAAHPAPAPGAPASAPASATPVLATSDEEITRRTGHGWEAWFDLLDEWGAAERPHREISRWVADRLGVVPLAWAAQAITVSYERARGGRAVGEHPEGFAITASRTMAVGVEQLYRAFVDEAARANWMPDGELRERTATPPRSARFDWDDGRSRVGVVLDVLGERKSRVAVEHARLADAGEAERMKAWWRARLTALKTQLESGPTHA
jgi:hypothetical protein